MTTRSKLIWISASCSLLLALFLTIASLVGVSPRYIINAPEMLVGFTAKTACSLRYVSDFPENRVRQDIATYSPLFNFVEVGYLTEQKRVVANLLWKERQAQFHEGLGCTLVSEQDAELPVAVSSMQEDLDPRVTNQAVQAALNDVLERENAEGWDTRALLVINKKGQVIAESYADGYHADSMFLGWSMTKTAFALLAGVMERQGYLTMEDRELFPEWQDDRAGLQLQHLLTMTTGLDFEETYEPGADATRMLFHDESVVARAKASEQTREAGEHWSYCSGTSNLLAAYLQQKLGGEGTATLAFMTQQLFQPLGMSSVVIEVDAQGLPVASSFMYATAEDWAKLGLLLLNRGQLNNGVTQRQLLEPSWVDAAITSNSSGNDPRYGYQLWLNSELNGSGSGLRWPGVPADAYAALGNRGQVVMVLPQQEWVVVRLGWAKSQSDRGKYPKGNVAAELLSRLQTGADVPKL